MLVLGLVCCEGKSKKRGERLPPRAGALELRSVRRRANRGNTQPAPPATPVHYDNGPQ